MLLESEQWSSNAGLLTWEVKSLCSKRVVDFTDTQLNTPLPSNASALILNQRDIQSSRCLFRLVLSAHHIEGIESSSLLITPTAVMTCENPDNMRARAERKGYQNGTKFGSLESQVMYDPKVKSLLKTPCAMDATADSRQSKSISGTSGTLAQEIASGYVEKRGWFLPTPTCNDATNQSLPKSQEERNDSLVKRILKGELGVSIPKKDGHPFRLSPLFTEEMMGFPLMWTSWPFLLESGERSQ